MINKRNLMNALEMYIDDYTDDTEDIIKEEMEMIKKNFDRMFEQLKEKASITQGEEGE